MKVLVSLALIILIIFLSFSILNKEPTIVIIKDPNALKDLQSQIVLLKAENIKLKQETKDAANIETNATDNETNIELLALQNAKLQREIEKNQKQTKKLTAQKDKLVESILGDSNG